MAISKKYCSIKRILRLKKQYVWRCVCHQCQVSQTITQSRGDHPASAPPRVHLINQIWLQTSDNMVAVNQTPGYKMWVTNPRFSTGYGWHRGEILSFSVLEKTEATDCQFCQILSICAFERNKVSVSIR